MCLNRIRDFLATVQAGSIRAAAAGREPAGAHQERLRQLENNLGAALLAGGVRGARPYLRFAS